MKKGKKRADNSSAHERTDIPLKDDELEAVTGGLYGDYADVTIDYTNDCETVLVQEEIANAKGKGGCGKP